MPKNAFSKREDLICGKLDLLEDLLDRDIAANHEIYHLIAHIRFDGLRMEAKLVSRKDEVLELAERLRLCLAKET